MTSKNSVPSAHDVARLAGVSQAAVSRAFTEGASISNATRAKVFDAARELGYLPNRHARSLITGKSGAIGVVIGNPRNTFYLEALDALSTRLSDAGYHLLVFTARPDDNPDKLVEALIGFRVESLMMMSANLSLELAEQCRSKGITVVYFNRRSGMGTVFPSVTGANIEGAGAIAEHLLEQGYRHLAYVAGSDRSSTSQEREAGFVSHILSRGLSVPERAVGAWGHAAAPAVRDLLSRNPRPDAIFCMNDMMALAAIEIARFEFGLQIGRDLGVAGFDNIEGASWLSFDLTTYSQPVVEMVDRAIEIMLHPTDFATSVHFAVKGELIARGSTHRG